jgi:hypothetical protein
MKRNAVALEWGPFSLRISPGETTSPRNQTRGSILKKKWGQVKILVVRSRWSHRCGGDILRVNSLLERIWT